MFIFQLSVTKNSTLSAENRQSNNRMQVKKTGKKKSMLSKRVGFFLFKFYFLCLTLSCEHFSFSFQ